MNAFAPVWAWRQVSWLPRLRPGRRRRKNAASAPARRASTPRDGDWPDGDLSRRRERLAVLNTCVEGSVHCLDHGGPRLIERASLPERLGQFDGLRPPHQPIRGWVTRCTQAQGGE